MFRGSTTEQRRNWMPQRTVSLGVGISPQGGTQLLAQPISRAGIDPGEWWGEDRTEKRGEDEEARVTEEMKEDNNKKSKTSIRNSAISCLEARRTPPGTMKILPCHQFHQSKIPLPFFSCSIEYGAEINLPLDFRGCDR